MNRDLLGYGGKLAGCHLAQRGHASRFRWSSISRKAPNGRSGDGDPRSELIGEVVSVIPEGGSRPGAGNRSSAYGMRAGLWRVLDGLAAASVPATFLACGPRGRARSLAGPRCRRARP